MGMSAASRSRLASVGDDGDRFYLGYRWPGVATVRLPSGGNVSAAHSDRALADAVLRDRLHRAPHETLLDRFCHEWMLERGPGEFAWPVAAVDKWLASAAAGQPRRRCTSCGLHTRARRMRAGASQRCARGRWLRGGQ